MSEIYESLEPQDRDTQDVEISGDESDDEAASPPDQMPRAAEWGLTAYEQGQEETIDQRIAQEVPDPNSAYGAPDDEGGWREPQTVGGDDPDAIPAEQDFLGDPSLVDAEGAADVDDDLGELVADDEGAREDTDKEPYATSEGPAGTAPEESAMHVVDED